MDVGCSRLLPDFLIIGRMKAGTTTLSRWLAAQPEVFFCRVDEPRFFNDDTNWARGLDWYRSMFEGARDEDVLGEASPGYTHPGVTDAAAERMASVVGDAKLIYLVRHPIERIRSEYRHRRMMGDESRSLLDSLREPHWFYLRQSMYYRCLSPYIDRFSREQILVVRSEDLDSLEAWHDVLRHVGLSPRPVPGGAHNVSEERGMYPSLVQFRRSAELRRRLRWVPASVRRLPARMLRRRGADFDQMLAESRAPIPDELVAPVWEDVSQLEAWLGSGELWRRDYEPDRA